MTIIAEFNMPGVISAASNNILVLRDSDHDRAGSC